MVRYPDKAASFTLPSLDALKSILYKNDIGYKHDASTVPDSVSVSVSVSGSGSGSVAATDSRTSASASAAAAAAAATAQENAAAAAAITAAGGKLMIKRFYRLPMLLFPKETFTTVLLMDQTKLRYAVRPLTSTSTVQRHIILCLIFGLFDADFLSIHFLQT
jgi:hypothetical protein